MRRRVLIVLAGLAVLFGGAVAAFVIHRLQEAGNVRGSSTVEFVTTEQHVTEPSTVPWPTYGFSPDRTRSVQLALRPPFRIVWRYQAGSLIEFPPSIGFDRLFFSTNAGTFAAVAPGAAAMNTLAHLLAWKLSLHGIDAAGRTVVEVSRYGSVYSRYRAGTPVHLHRIAGHRDGDTTTCPGSALYGRLPSLRRRTAALKSAWTSVRGTSPIVSRATVAR